MTCADDGTNGDWDLLCDGLAARLRALRPGQFLLVEFVEHDGVPPWSPWPYAQCAWNADGWYCEAVSENFLPATSWPLDGLALRRAGWLPPIDEAGNWYRHEQSADGAARMLVEALRHSRDCQDPGRYRWEVGTFPTGPDGGEPVAVCEPSLFLAA